MSMSSGIMKMHYLQYVQQKPFKEKSMPVGSPHLRLLLTGILQEVLLKVRGEPQETSLLGLKSK